MHHEINVSNISVSSDSQVLNKSTDLDFQFLLPLAIYVLLRWFFKMQNP